MRIEFYSRVGLRKALVEWRKIQFNQYSNLCDEITALESDPLKPEAEKLLLPSHFSEAKRFELGLGDQIKMEFSLREGQVHDAL
jgi:hypothetical protein